MFAVDQATSEPLSPSWTQGSHETVYTFNGKYNTGKVTYSFCCIKSIPMDQDD